MSVCEAHGFEPSPSQPIPPSTCPQCNAEDIRRLVPRTPVIAADHIGPNGKLIVDGRAW